MLISCAFETSALFRVYLNLEWPFNVPFRSSGPVHKFPCNMDSCVELLQMILLYAGVIAVQ
jgi:hypothetical protein